MSLSSRQREALRWIEQRGPLYSWAVKRSGFPLRTWEALAEKGVITREETTSRYTKLPIVVYRHPLGHEAEKKVS